MESIAIETNAGTFKSKSEAVAFIIANNVHPSKKSKRSFDNVKSNEIVNIINEWYNSRNAIHTQETQNMTETAPVAPVQPSDIESIVKAAVAAALVGMMPTASVPVTQSAPVAPAPVAPAPVRTYQPIASYVNTLAGSQMDSAVNQYIRALATRKLIVYRPLYMNKKKQQKPMSLTIVFDIQHRTFTALDYYVSPETGNVTVQVGGRYGNNVFSTCDEIETWLNDFKNVSPQMRTDIVNLCRIALSQ
jgi:hypothetical protein